MGALYILIGLALIMISVALLFKRNEMKRQTKNIAKEQAKQIIALNHQLDEIDLQLKKIQTPITKINSISLKILSYMK